MTLTLLFWFDLFEFKNFVGFGGYLKRPKGYFEINWPLVRAAFVKVIHDFFPCTTCGRVVIWFTFRTKKTKHTFIEVHWKKLFRSWQLFIFWKLISFCVNSFIVMTKKELRIWVVFKQISAYYLFNTCIKSKREFGIGICMYFMH